MQALAFLAAVESWPLWVGFGYMFVVAAVYKILDRVPNALSLSAVVTGWAAAFLVEFAPGILSRANGGLFPSLVGSVACLVMLLKAYKIGLGAGCLKAQMGLGAWIGCALPLETTLIVSVFATLCGGSLLAIFWIIAARRAGVRLGDFALGHHQPDRFYVLHAQPPLALGSIGGVLLAFALSAQGPRPLAPAPLPQAQVGGIN